MFIVFDTNIWWSELAFQSSLGSAARLFILKRGATVAVPEVVRREVEINFEEKISKAIKDVEKAHRELLAIFGEMQTISVPSLEQVKAKAQNIVAELDVPKRDLPITLETTRSSLEKVLRKQQPSGDNNQQFKDGVIWADCLMLAQEADVYLISDDKAFYKGRDLKNGLASNLLAEEKFCPFRITLLSSLADLLPQISSVIQVDEAHLVEQILQSRTFSDDPIKTNGFIIQRLSIIKTKLFHTENANRVYLEFEADFLCRDATEQGRPDGHLICKGHCDYNPVTQKASGVFLGEIILEYETSEGELTSTGLVMGSSALSLGQQMIRHSIRTPMDG